MFDHSSNFLGDYGLIWVGDQEDRDAKPPSHLDLNILSGEGESFVERTATGAQLAKKAPVQLRLYSNGIVMFDGPFRSYQEHSTQQCMQDLMDGYFPSELSERFPDGVPFEVHDRRDEEFVFRLPWEAFPGEGQTVCGMKAEAKLTTDQFLNKLPKLVVKGGRVIDVRDSVRATLQVSRNIYQQPSVTLYRLLRWESHLHSENVLIGNSGSPAVVSGPTQVRVHPPALFVSLFFHRVTPAACLNHRGIGLPGYDIISVHPQRCYDDNGQTLRSCGLTTNANLLLRKRRHGDPAAEDNKPVQG
uniref:UBX domain-containing protein 11 n=1 Tax=Amphiprion percula TaxID=161767 RepID=A0A3P8TV11_AMPPE